MSKIAAFAGSCALSSAQHRLQPIEMAARALLAAASAGIGEAVEKRRLLGEDHERAAGSGEELDGRQRQRDALLVEIHVIGVDDALLRHDVEIVAVELGHHAARETAAQPLLAADAKIEAALDLLPTFGADEPARPRLRRCPGGKDTLRRRIVG